MEVDSVGSKASTSTRKKRVFLWLKVIVSIALMAWILARTDFDSVLAAFAVVDYTWVVGAFLSQIVGSAIIAWRWRALLSVNSVTPGYPYLLKSTLASLFFRQFMPSVIGGDALRGYDAWKAGASPGFAIISLFVDRIVGLLALALFALAALLILNRVTLELSGAIVPIIGGIIAILVVVTAMFSARGHAASRTALLMWLPASLRHRIEGRLEGLSVYRGHGKLLGRVFLWSVALQINVVTFYWMLSNAFGFDLPYGAFFAIVPLALFILMLPITINGIGLRETVFVFLLGIWAVEPGEALAFAWLEFALILACGMFGGLIYLLRDEPTRLSSFPGQQT